MMMNIMSRKNICGDLSVGNKLNRTETGPLGTPAVREIGEKWLESVTKTYDLLAR